MCCNGVLFGDVELQRGDDATALTAFGLELFRKGRRRAFAQPCACFDGRLCRIYGSRPRQCAAFECGLLKKVHRGNRTTADALKTIAEMRRRVEAVRRLLRLLGNEDEKLPLNLRYSAVISQPIDLSAKDDSGVLRDELMSAVAGLVDLIEKEFLS